MKAVTITNQQYQDLNSPMVGEKFIVDEIRHGGLVTLILATEEEVNTLVPNDADGIKALPTKSTKKPRRYRPKFKKGMQAQWVNHQGRTLIGDITKYHRKMVSVTNVFEKQGCILSRLDCGDFVIDTQEIDVTASW